MNNKPVAWMWYQSKENTNPYTQMTGYSQLCFSEFEPDCNVVTVDDGTLTPLYTHPVKELNDGGEPVKNATYWKRQYNLMATQNDNLKSGLYHANEQIKYLEGQLEVAQQLTKMRLENSAPSVKELTDEEIIQVMMNVYSDTVPPIRGIDFAKAILRKAQEK